MLIVSHLYLYNLLSRVLRGDRDMSRFEKPLVHTSAFSIWITIIFAFDIATDLHFFTNTSVLTHADSNTNGSSG